MTIRLRPLIKPDGRICRIRLSEPGSTPTFAVSVIVRVDDLWVVEAYPLAGPSASITPDIRVSIPPSLHSRYRSFIATTQDSDFQTDAYRLTGRTGLLDRLSLGLPLTHRFGSPRLSDAFRPDVLTTLTPTEFTGAGDCLSCEHRPSHKTPEARRLRSFNITRLIRCGSSSFRPVGSVPGLLSPPALRHGQAPGCSVANRPIRRVGLAPTSFRTLRGLLRGCLSIDDRTRRYPFFLFSAPKASALKTKRRPRGHLRSGYRQATPPRCGSAFAELAPLLIFARAICIQPG